MRFLQSILTVIWLLFGWLCFSALQWEKPMPMPWHVADELEVERRRANINDDDIVDYLHKQLTKWKYLLSQEEIEGAIRADTHFTLAFYHWLLAYFQPNLIRQKASLQLSLHELDYALDYWQSQEYQSDPRITYQVARIQYSKADILFQLKQYQEAEPLFLSAMKRAPGNPRFYRRYMNFLEESGFENKIDVDVYFQNRPRKSR